MQFGEDFLGGYQAQICIVHCFLLIVKIAFVPCYCTVTFIPKYPQLGKDYFSHSFYVYKFEVKKT